MNVSANGVKSNNFIVPVDQKQKTDTPAVPNRALENNQQISGGSLSDVQASRNLIVSDLRIARLSDDPPTAAELTVKVRNLARATGTNVTDNQLNDIKNLDRVQRRMYADTLGSLQALSQGRINQATYMTNIVSRAAQLGTSYPLNNTPGRNNGEQRRMAELIGIVFSDPPGGFKLEASRAAAGSPPSLAGSALEQINRQISLGKNDSAKGGFNRNIIDVNAESTVTHHFRELLMVGFNQGRSVGNLATENIGDDIATNPGDVRNGYFGSMLGSNLATGDISNSEASQLVEWAYKNHSGTQPPWGNSPNNYILSDWQKALRNR
jgi:hypothetical protein